MLTFIDLIALVLVLIATIDGVAVYRGTSLMQTMYGRVLGVFIGIARFLGGVIVMTVLAALVLVAIIATLVGVALFIAGYSVYWLLCWPGHAWRRRRLRRNRDKRFNGLREDLRRATRHN